MAVESVIATVLMDWPIMPGRGIGTNTSAFASESPRFLPIAPPHTNTMDGPPVATDKYRPAYTLETGTDASCKVQQTVQ